MIRTGALLGILWPALALAAPSETANPDPRVSSLVHSVDLLGLIGDPVTDSDWRQVARIERVLVDPGSGRATFVVVSFVDREGMFALPWNDLIIDERGRARLGSRSVAKVFVSTGLADSKRLARARRLERTPARLPLALRDFESMRALRASCEGW